MHGEQIYSLGFIAQHLQRDAYTIRTTFEDLKLFPVLHINDIPHYCRPDLDRLAKHLADEERENMRVTR